MFKINALKVMRALEVDAPFSDGVTHVDLLLFWVGTLILLFGQHTTHLE